jgi:hypothetical protein
MLQNLTHTDDSWASVEKVSVESFGTCKCAIYFCVCIFYFILLHIFTCSAHPERIKSVFFVCRIWGTVFVEREKKWVYEYADFMGFLSSFQAWKFIYCIKCGLWKIFFIILWFKTQIVSLRFSWMCNVLCVYEYYSSSIRDLVDIVLTLQVTFTIIMGKAYLQYKFKCFVTLLQIFIIISFFSSQQTLIFSAYTITSILLLFISYLFLIHE